MRAVGHAPAGLQRRLVIVQARKLAERGEGEDGKQRQGPHIEEQARQRADDLVGTRARDGCWFRWGAAGQAWYGGIRCLLARSNVVLGAVLA